MIYDESGTKLVKQVDIDCMGHYRVELQAAEYTVDINRVGIDRSGDIPKKVDIRPGHTIDVNIDIDTGIR